ncbi:hypothetical protein [Gimesia panareensis]|uniref:Uncharacterized protein n=1 Tax=Gimesia panareensis TaxID=2527978 RepID=A0A518AEV9_9PLAN|nr:hypothetical protein [Gimesia panareensis]QDT30145.1 hypothetical protein Enr10x_55050 [Gimesia panareensis]QDU53234.1 hypothetical protein Pan110_56190 [Gimesia panareensis]
MNLLILAAGDWGGAVFGILILLISAASAIANAAKEKNKAQPGKTKEKAQLQKELEKFLQDAMNPQQEKQPERKPRQARAAEPVEIDLFEDDGIEAVASSPQPPRRQQRQRRSTQSSSRGYQQKQQASGKVPAQKANKKKHVSHRERNQREEEERQKRLGGSLRDRIEKSQKKHIKSRVHSQIDSKVGQHLSDTFGMRSADGTTLGPRKGAASLIREALKDRQSFRQAYILSEILSPPKSRRRS